MTPIVTTECSYQGQQGDVSQSLCAETMKPVFERDNVYYLGNASVYQVNPASRITGEGRAEF